MTFGSPGPHSLSPSVWLNPIAGLVEVAKGPCTVNSLKTMHAQLE